MSNINEIEVNGTVYGIKSVNDIYVGRTEPTTDIKPELWLKSKGIYSTRSEMGMEVKDEGGDTYQGNYTLDDEGNLVETTDTSSSTGFRTTKLFGVFHDRKYKLAFIDNFSSSSSTKTWSVYFYRADKTFISKISVTTDASITYDSGDMLLEINLPADTKYVRILSPYSYTERCVLCEFSVTKAEISATRESIMFGRGGSSGSIFYQWDEDHYVRV